MGGPNQGDDKSKRVASLSDSFTSELVIPQYSAKYCFSITPLAETNHYLPVSDTITNPPTRQHQPADKEVNPCPTDSTTIRHGTTVPSYQANQPPSLHQGSKNRIIRVGFPPLPPAENTDPTAARKCIRNVERDNIPPPSQSAAVQELPNSPGLPEESLLVKAFAPGANARELEDLLNSLKCVQNTNIKARVTKDSIEVNFLGPSQEVSNVNLSWATFNRNRLLSNAFGVLTLGCVSALFVPATLATLGALPLLGGAFACHLLSVGIKHANTELLKGVLNFNSVDSARIQAYDPQSMFAYAVALAHFSRATPWIARRYDASLKTILTGKFFQDQNSVAKTVTAKFLKAAEIVVINQEKLSQSEGRDTTRQEIDNVLKGTEVYIAPLAKSLDRCHLYYQLVHKPLANAVATARALAFG